MKKVPIFAGAVAVAAFFAAMPADAQRQSRGSERIRQVVVYGKDRCPRSTSAEIVVCARRPESERYRIPRALRNTERSRGGTSWAERARSLEYVGRSGTQSCSTSGPGGLTGCWEQMMRNAREERRAAGRR
jgi:hypothetical protein